MQCMQIINDPKKDWRNEVKYKERQGKNVESETEWERRIKFVPWVSTAKLKKRKKEKKTVRGKKIERMEKW